MEPLGCKAMEVTGGQNHLDCRFEPAAQLWPMEYYDVGRWSARETRNAVLWKVFGLHIRGKVPLFGIESERRIMTMHCCYSGCFVLTKLNSRSMTMMISAVVHVGAIARVRI